MAINHNTLLGAISAHRSLDTTIEALGGLVSHMADNEPLTPLLDILVCELQRASSDSFSIWMGATEFKPVHGLVRLAGEDFCHVDLTCSFTAYTKMFSENTAH